MLEEGLSCTFKINIEYISVDINLSKVAALESLIKWWSWVMRLVELKNLLARILYHG